MKQPVRLAKQNNNQSYSWFNSLMNMAEAWILNHATLCLCIGMAILTALFVLLIFALIGVSATESGTMRNFVNGGYI